MRGQCSYTSKRLPCQIVYTLQVNCRKVARMMEKRIKHKGAFLYLKEQEFLKNVKDITAIIF
jgi:predicted GIY-YIG superfamily endonuclease